MNKEILKHYLKFCFSRTSRKAVKTYQDTNFKLIMTLMVKDEEEIIEKNIRFHHAMGVDGFIVTSHNSTDNTNPILEKLKKEGLVLEIIKKSTPEYDQKNWVWDMIDIAHKKYHADWIINADADEFYYSKSLNLKKSIHDGSDGKANVLWVDSLFLYPDDRDDFLTCPYFITRPFQKFEAENLGIAQNPDYAMFIGSQNCTKVIHSAKGNPHPCEGNHICDIKNKVCIQSADINLYHYHVKNYRGYEEKAIRWKVAQSYNKEKKNQHIKYMIKLYDEGKLREDYEKKYGKEMQKFLLENGVVTKDPSVVNFMKYKGLL